MAQRGLGASSVRENCVNILIGLVEHAAQRLDAADWDIEVLETHHRRKVDAPSGTALMLGEAAASGRNEDLDDVRAAPWDGITGARESGKIGFASIRAGGIIGDHTVLFASEDEVLTLSHSAIDRSLFAKGAVAAARAARPGASMPSSLVRRKCMLARIRRAPPGLVHLKSLRKAQAEKEMQSLVFRPGFIKSEAGFRIALS